VGRAASASHPNVLAVLLVRLAVAIEQVPNGDVLTVLLLLSKVIANLIEITKTEGRTYIHWKHETL